MEKRKSSTPPPPPPPPRLEVEGGLCRQRMSTSPATDAAMEKRMTSSLGVKVRCDRCGDPSPPLT